MVFQQSYQDINTFRSAFLIKKNISWVKLHSYVCNESLFSLFTLKCAFILMRFQCMQNCRLMLTLSWKNKKCMFEICNHDFSRKQNIDKIERLMELRLLLVTLYTCVARLKTYWSLVKRRIYVTFLHHLPRYLKRLSSRRSSRYFRVSEKRLWLTEWTFRKATNELD